MLDKQKTYRKNIDGSKEPIYRETSSDVVKHGSTTVEAKLIELDNFKNNGGTISGSLDVNGAINVSNTVTSESVMPKTPSQSNIGTSSSKFKEGHFDNLYAGGSPIISYGVDGTFAWYKYANGMMIQRRTIQVTIAMNRAWGSLFVGDVASYGWAIGFLEAPHVHAQTQSSAYDCWVINIKNTSATMTGDITVCRATTVASGSVTLIVTGIGRWK